MIFKPVFRFALLAGLMMSGGVAAAGSAEPAHCPPGDSLSTAQARAVFREAPVDLFDEADVLAGTDLLGRVVIALDGDRDGLADHVALYTHTARLGKSWTRTLHGARVRSALGRLYVQAADDSFALSLSLPEARPWPVPKEVGSRVVHAGGIELAQIELDAVDARPLGSFAVDNPSSWPDAFAEDLLDIQTAPPCTNAGHCTAGNPGARSCGVSCGSAPGCSVSCDADYFPCCNCGGVFLGPRCRCKRCIPGTPN